MRSDPQKIVDAYPGLRSWKRYLAIMLVAATCYFFFFKVVFF